MCAEGQMQDLYNMDVTNNVITHWLDCICIYFIFSDIRNVIKFGCPSVSRFLLFYVGGSMLIIFFFRILLHPLGILMYLFFFHFFDQFTGPRHFSLEKKSGTFLYKKVLYQFIQNSSESLIFRTTCVIRLPI